eukprot:CAMPEP_0196582206 /NCGR_PEP_ID=MMETSP1081-20130531/38002_1 /TAXON_ID=36882 /ORGANISM="Pyramimonas amylifera, Strain CCMP720" /LENGTH=446 /DNA_ID=CAMNT_0041902705 /DNA_START=89 /DNA_END=1429 /DNA_ORIENTATION=-
MASNQSNFPFAADLTELLGDLSVPIDISESLMQNCAKNSDSVGEVVGSFVEVLKLLKSKWILDTGGIKNGNFHAKAPISNRTTAFPSAEVIDISSACTSVHDVSMLAPRGKFSLSVLKDMFVISNKTTQIPLLFSAIDQVIVLEKPKDSRGTVYIMLQLARGSVLQHGKQALKCLLFQSLSKDQLDIPHPQNPEGRLTGVAAVVLCQLFGLVLGKAPVSSDAKYFRAMKGGGAIPATHKVNPGLLFPLKSGIVFVDRPAMFICADDVTKLELGRANGTSATFDFTLHLSCGEVVEFGMLPREELASLTDFLTQRKFGVSEEKVESIKASKENKATKEAPNVALSVDSDSDDSEDVNFDPSRPDSDDEEEEASGKHNEAGGRGKDKETEEENDDGDKKDDDSESDEGSSGSDEEDARSEDLSGDSDGDDVVRASKSEEQRAKKQKTT